jgi:uncharacterized membrane protein (UPF0136 family)
VDRKVIYWSFGLFFGCSFVFWGINQLAKGSGKGVSLAIQCAALVVILVAVTLISRRKS